MSRSSDHFSGSGYARLGMDMIALQLLFRGILAGFAISAPVGPVNVLCISRTIAKGRAGGLRCGVGAAVADTIYGAIAGFSISFIIGFLVREEFWIRFVGGLLLMAIGVRYLRKRPRPLQKNGADVSRSDYVAAFLLNLTNPTTVLSFLAILAALGAGSRQESWLTLMLVGGIFCGAMAWWVVLADVANRFRDRFDERAMLWMNRIAGLAIGGFGAVAMALSAGLSR
jgi:threonine/homoserine/homoserine lactone efflux protein